MRKEKKRRRGEEEEEKEKRKIKDEGVESLPVINNLCLMFQ